MKPYTPHIRTRPDYGEDSASPEKGPALPRGYNDSDEEDNEAEDGEKPKDSTNISIAETTLRANLKEQLIKLGNTNPNLRQHLTPILDVLTGRSKRASGKVEYIVEDWGGNMASIVLRENENPLQMDNPLTGQKIRYIHTDISPPGDYSQFVTGPFGETSPVSRGTEPLEAPDYE